MGCVVDEDELGEGVLWNEVTRSPLTLTVIMLLGMNDTDAEWDLSAVLTMLSRVVWSVFIIRAVAASFPYSMNCSRWPTVSVSDRT